MISEVLIIAGYIKENIPVLYTGKILQGYIKKTIRGFIKKNIRELYKGKTFHGYINKKIFESFKTFEFT